MFRKNKMWYIVLVTILYVPSSDLGSTQVFSTAIPHPFIDSAVSSWSFVRSLAVRTTVFSPDLSNMVAAKSPLIYDVALSGSSSINKHRWARSAPWMSPSELWWRFKAFELGVRGRSDANPLICNTSVSFSFPSNDCAKDLGEILLHGAWSVGEFWSWCGPNELMLKRKASA